MSSSTRPLEPSDLPEVAALFKTIFQGDRRPPSPELIGYFRDLLFGSPAYDREVGSLVHVGPQGRIDAVLCATPIRMRCEGETFTGRMLTNFMSSDPGAATSLSLSLRRRTQDFLFSESSRPETADALKAMGAAVLPIQSLEWVKVFRPAALGLDHLAHGAGGPAWRALAPAAGALDGLTRRLVRRLAPVEPNELHLTPIDTETFIAAAPALLESYALRPAWDADELGWLVAMARRRTTNGPLTFARLADRDGRDAGLAAYFAAPGRMALVLNLLVPRGRQTDAAAQALLAHLDAMGCAGARGMCQPREMDAWIRQPGVFFRPKGYLVCSSRHEAVRRAAERGDIYIGGLAGESWARLLGERF